MIALTTLQLFYKYVNQNDIYRQKERHNNKTLNYFVKYFLKSIHDMCRLNVDYHQTLYSDIDSY